MANVVRRACDIMCETGLVPLTVGAALTAPPPSRRRRVSISVGGPKRPGRYVATRADRLLMLLRCC
jgi:hypothetical protein